MEFANGVPLLVALPRQVTARIRRVHYVYGRDIDRSNGPVELRLADRRTLLVDVVSGDRLRVTEGEWVDAFAPPLSEENERFVARSGKWSAFDVTDEPGYRELIGRPVTSVTTLHWDAVVTGAIVRVGESCLRIRAGFDELLVDHDCQPLPAHLDPSYRGP